MNSNDRLSSEEIEENLMKPPPTTKIPKKASSGNPRGPKKNSSEKESQATSGSIPDSPATGPTASTSRQEDSEMERIMADINRLATEEIGRAHV